MTEPTVEQAVIITVAQAIAALTSALAASQSSGAAAQKYLVLEAGLDNNHDGEIDAGEGGKVYAVALPAPADAVIEALLPYIGVQNDTITVEGGLDIHPFRKNILGIIVKSKGLVENFEAELKIVDAATLATLPNAIIQL